MATEIQQENTAAIAANTEAISDLAAALAAEIENRRQIVDRAGAAAMEAVDGMLRSGFMPWEFSGYSEGVEISEVAYAEGRWSLELDYGGSHYSLDAEGGPDATELYFAGQYKDPEDTIRAARHLVTPTKTSQLTNDSGFLTQHQDISGKMDGNAAYPAWSSAASYAEGQIVWHAGKAWIALNDAVPADVPGDGSTWLEYDGTLYAQIKAKQDALSQPQLAAVEKAGKAVLTLSIASAAGYAHAGQAVVVGGRTFPQPDWANRPPVVLAGAGRAEISYDGYASDCSVRLNGVDVGRPGYVDLEADSLLEVSFADCLHPDTPVLMADGTRKRVADVRAGDRVATPFGPDEVTRTSAGRGARMDEWQFSDGTTVRTVGRHRFWNADLGEFMYLEAWNVGERAVRADGTVAELVSRRTSEGDFPHATLFTARWNVYYAGGLVAGNRKSARPWR